MWPATASRSMPCGAPRGPGSSSRGLACRWPRRSWAMPASIPRAATSRWPASRSASAACRWRTSPAPGRGCGEHVYQQFRTPDRGDARMADLAGTHPARHAQRDGRLRQVLLIASPRRDGADPGTGDRVVPGHSDGHLGRLQDPGGPRVRQVPPAGRRGGVHRAVRVDRQPDPKPAAHVHRRRAGRVLPGGRLLRRRVPQPVPRVHDPGHLPADSRRGTAPARSPPPAPPRHRRRERDGDDRTLEAEQGPPCSRHRGPGRAACPLRSPGGPAAPRPGMVLRGPAWPPVLPGLAHRRLPPVLRAGGRDRASLNPLHAAAQLRHPHPDALGRRRQGHRGLAALPGRLHGTPEVLLDSMVRPPAARAPRGDRPDLRGRHHPGGDAVKTSREAADGFYRHLREWFTAFLPRQRGAAGNTITSCRQTWNMLLGYVTGHHHVAVEKVTFTMVDRATVTGFLDHMQATKSWTASTRNQRLACIRSFFTYAAAAEPALAIYLADLAAIPRLNGPAAAPVKYMTTDAVTALLAAPDPGTRIGLRDQLFMILMYDLAARDAEMLALNLADIDTRRLTADLPGKGSKPRRLPITSETARHFGRYAAVFHPSPEPAAPMFYTVRNHRPTRMSDDNVARFVRQHAATAKARCPDVPARVHPHMLRHSRAMHLYQAGMPLALLTEWLGHADPETTLIYAHADTEMKRHALEKQT